MDRKNRGKAKTILIETLQWLCIVALIWTAFSHFQPSSGRNTHTEIGIVTNIQNVHTTNREWIFFEMDGKGYYFAVMERNSENRARLMQGLEQAAHEKSPVQLGVINTMEWAHFLEVAERERVVTISCPSLSVSAEEFNRDQRGLRTILLCMAAGLIALKLFLRINEKALRPVQRHGNKGQRKKKSEHENYKKDTGSLFPGNRKRR